MESQKDKFSFCVCSVKHADIILQRKHAPNTTYDNLKNDTYILDIFEKKTIQSIAKFCD